MLIDNKQVDKVESKSFGILLSLGGGIIRGNNRLYRSSSGMIGFLLSDFQERYL